MRPFLRTSATFSDFSFWLSNSGVNFSVNKRLFFNFSARSKFEIRTSSDFYFKLTMSNRSAFNTKRASDIWRNGFVSLLTKSKSPRRSNPSIQQQEWSYQITLPTLRRLSETAYRVCVLFCLFFASIPKLQCLPTSTKAQPKQAFITIRVIMIFCVSCGTSSFGGNLESERGGLLRE